MKPRDVANSFVRLARLMVTARAAVCSEREVGAEMERESKAYNA